MITKWKITDTRTLKLLASHNLWWPLIMLPQVISACKKACSRVGKYWIFGRTFDYDGVGSFFGLMAALSWWKTSQQPHCISRWCSNKCRYGQTHNHTFSLRRKAYIPFVELHSSFIFHFLWTVFTGTFSVLTVQSSTDMKVVVSKWEIIVDQSKVQSSCKNFETILLHFLKL